jgi:tetratricopeptide (TPR) repeat protein
MHRLAVEAARRLNSHTAQIYALRGLASSCAMLSRFDEASSYSREALKLSVDLGDLVVQAETHISIASLEEQLGRIDGAVHHAQHAVDLYQRAGKEIGLARGLNVLAWYQVQHGDLPQAIESCHRALRLLEDLDDVNGQANTWDTIGCAYHELGRYAEALASFQRALSLGREVGIDRYTEADFLRRLGDSHRAAGDLVEADRAWQDAAAIVASLGGAAKSL